MSEETELKETEILLTKTIKVDIVEGLRHVDDIIEQLKGLTENIEVCANVLDHLCVQRRNLEDDDTPLYVHTGQTRCITGIQYTGGIQLKDVTTTCLKEILLLQINKEIEHHENDIKESFNDIRRLKTLIVSKV